MKPTPLMIAVAAIAVCAGCETETPYFDSQLGTSSAHLLEAQILNPAAAGNPAPLAPAGADGQRIEAAVENYHKDVPKQEQSVSRPIVFEVNGGGGSGGGG
jgi:hypothetical protein